MTARKRCGVQLALLMVILMTTVLGFAQEFSTQESGRQEKFRASIVVLSPFRFGAFYPGALGGTVNLSYEGLRTATGSVVLLPPGIVGPAVLQLRTASNSMVHIHYDKRLHLKSSYGAFIVMWPGELSLGNPFVSPPNSESGFLVTLGGLLELDGGNHNPPGEYCGTIHFVVVVE